MIAYGRACAHASTNKKAKWSYFQKLIKIYERESKKSSVNGQSCVCECECVRACACVCYMYFNMTSLLIFLAPVWPVPSDLAI